MKANRFVALLALAATVIALAGCSGQQPTSSAPDSSEPVPPLEGTSWSCITFTTAGGVPTEVPAGTPITAEFSTDGRVSGSAGVNTYNTTYQTDGDAITIDPNVVTTKMAGPQEAMDRESDYLLTLPEAKRYSVNADGELILFGAAGNTIARYGPAQ